MRLSKVWCLATAAFGLQLKKDDPGFREKHCVHEVNRRANIDFLKKELELYRQKHGIPGLCFMASANGQTYQVSIGHSDVENDVPCSERTVMRIASISKPLTCVAVLKLWEEGKISLEKSVQEYVQSFPLKEYGGAPVNINTQQLLAHLAGIRGYDKKDSSLKGNDQEIGKVSKDLSNYEYYIKSHYGSVSESLKLFQDDDLVAKPGATYHYTTHGWTLLSAIVESASKVDFLQYMKEEVFQPLGMMSTVPELNDTLIINRARYYKREGNGQLFNTPYVDNSYKWAGGGFLSTVDDLVSFGNALLLSYNEHQRTTLGMKENNKAAQQLKFILNPSTVDMMWRSVVKTGNDYQYGLGWMITGGDSSEGNGTVGNIARRDPPLIAFHTGGAVGASSVLLIVPGPVSENDDPDVPKGVVLVLLVNLHDCPKIGEFGKSLALQIYKTIV